MSKTTDAERAQIEKALRNGVSVCAAARESGRAKGTVSAIAKAAGIDLERSATKKAVAARKDYAQAERLVALNQFFERAVAMLPKTITPLELQQLTTALAIMIDKRRLEDGEATSRAEVHGDGGSARERIAGRLDELAARRAAAGAA